ncbi:MAG: endonuclease III [Candidatus Lokiarchaeota archaeon]|nr:endonuclease III [Candidatus Lokiarchaeota archaeon]
MNYKDILDTINGAIEGEAHLDQLARKKQDPFKILISTILSARTRDSNTEEATKTLFAKYNTPELIANAEVEELEKLIFKSGFYRVKAVRIKEVSQIIKDKYSSIVPDNFEDLISLPGVGAKTANCVLVYAFKIPAIPVDTHVHRIPNRLGWIKTKKPEETEKELKKIIPEDQWIHVNRLFVRFGQEICLPNRPKCDLCPIDTICEKDFSMELALRNKKKKKS